MVSVPNARANEKCGAWGVGGDGVGTVDDVFRSPANAFVVIFWVCDLGAVASV
jgi:hypothetical protein